MIANLAVCDCVKEIPNHTESAGNVKLMYRMVEHH